MSFLVLVGVIITIGSHILKDLEERQFYRDTGSGIVAFAITKWLSQQGKRRIREDGTQLRNPTLKFKIPEDKNGSK